MYKSLPELRVFSLLPHLHLMQTGLGVQQTFSQHVPVSKKIKVPGITEDKSSLINTVKYQPTDISTVKPL